MLYEIVHEFPNEIIYEEKGPCISLYQSTDRHSTNNKKDLIKFNNLTQEVENSLKEKYSQKEVENLMKSLNSIGEDRNFWNYSKDGLAILVNSDKCVVYQLQRPVKELGVVADSFHIKPLIRNFQSADRYHLLGLSRDRFTLYEGNRYGFEEIKLGDDVLRTREEVLGDEHTQSYLSQGSYGGAGGTPMFHGHGSRKDEIDKEIEKYFRYVDKFVLENYSRPERIPLILVALDQHHGLFRSLSNNDHLLEVGIKKDYETLTKDKIGEEAWEVIEPLYLEKTKDLIEKYNLQRSKFLGSDDLAEIARAALENRVLTLLIESDKIISGKIDKDTGKLIEKDLENPEVDDILDDIAEIVFKYKGEVIVLPKERMPSDTGLAAIYRY